MCGALGCVSAIDTERTEGRLVGGSCGATSCDWPNVVSLGGYCTGVLVHPELVLYAAHCGTGFSTVTFGVPGAGTPVPIRYCRAYPEANASDGTDIAFCKLATRQSMPFAAIANGCERQAVSVGQALMVVGTANGSCDGGSLAAGYFKVTAVGQNIVIDDSAFGLCSGDSGGPAFAAVTDEGVVGDAYRLVGIASAGTSVACTPQASSFVDATRFITWLHSESHLAVTPCYNALGQWSPTPDCKAWSGSPVGSLCGAHEVQASTCGLPAPDTPSGPPPDIAFVRPTPKASVQIAPSEVSATVGVSLSVRSGPGVREVRLSVINAAGEVVAGDTSEVAPYEFADVHLREGRWALVAEAEDYLGQITATRVDIVVAATEGCGCSMADALGDTQAFLEVVLYLTALAMLRGRSRAKKEAVEWRHSNSK